MQPWSHNDFSAGWIPSDDQINGRKNGFLRMNNVELDKNGAVVLSAGPRPLITSAAFTNNLHSAFSRIVGGTYQRYFGDIAGNVLRGTTVIGTAAAGSTTRACFGVAFNYVLALSGNLRLKDNGTTVYNLGITKPTVAPTLGASIAGTLTGTYEYIQINVRRDGAYVGKSSKGPVTAEIELDEEYATITPEDPTTVDPQANEAWIFRRGGNLEQFYRVKVCTSFGAFNDTLSDNDALQLNIKLNEFTLSTNSTDLPEAILDVVGPINGRHIYFTATSIYYSEIDSPDTYDSRAVQGLSSNLSEIFLWARQIGANTVIIGTTANVYTLVGNFTQFPDGFMDIHLRSMNVKYKPLGIDCAVYNESLVYQSGVGPVILEITGETVPLAAPNTDRLHRGQQCYNYGGIPQYTYPAGGNFVRFSMAIARNKLWCVFPTIDHTNFVESAFTFRLEVYDFIRKYWRPTSYSPTWIIAEDNDNLFGFFDSDNKLRDFDYWADGNKLLNGTDAQAIDLLTPFFDLGSPRHRKELYTLKLVMNTGGSSLPIKMYINDDINHFVPYTIGSVNTTSLQEVIFDLSAIFGDNNIFPKSIQFEIAGSVNDFEFTSIQIEHDVNPIQTTFLRLHPTNYGTQGRKRIAGAAFVIDTLGQNVTCRLYVDRVLTLSTTINTLQKETFLFPFTSEVVGKDYEFEFDSGSGNVFEFYEALPPKTVEAFPEKLKYVVTPTTNYGSPTKKRIRTIPFVINTFGNDVDITPTVDGVELNSYTFNTERKETVLFQFEDDIFGIDFSFVFEGSNEFEFWEMLPPEIVQVLPPAKHFTQVGPIELFRLGKIKTIEFNLVAFQAPNVFTLHCEPSLTGLTLGSDYCPVAATEINADAFNSYANGAEPVPPWTKIVGTDAADPTTVYTAQGVKQAGPVFRLTIDDTLTAARRSENWKRWVLNPVLSTNQCGLYVQATLVNLVEEDDGVNTDFRGITGLIIGSDSDVFPFLLMQRHGDSSGATNRIRLVNNTEGTSLTNLITFTESSVGLGINRVFRLEITGNNPYIITAKINGTIVAVTSTTTAIPKKCGGLFVGRLDTASTTSNRGIQADWTNFSSGVF